MSAIRFQIDEAGRGGGHVTREGLYAALDEPRREVRRCARCGQATLIVCQAWQHSFAGAHTGNVTRDCRCQACGASVTLTDPRTIRINFVIGAIFLITLFGAPFLLFAWRRRRAWARSPLVLDAPFPALRHWRGPGNRRCGACGKLARLTRVTRNRTDGIPTGTDCSYTCTGCGREFQTESWGGVLFGLLGGGGMALGGAWWFVVATERSPKRMAGVGVMALLGAVLLLSALGKARENLRNPPLEGAEAAG